MPSPVGLVLPAGVECPHPDSYLVGAWEPDDSGGEDHRLSLLCRMCGCAWDQVTIPVGLLQRVVAKLKDGTWARPAQFYINPGL